MKNRNTVGFARAVQTPHTTLRARLASRDVDAVGVLGRQGLDMQDAVACCVSVGQGGETSVRVHPWLAARGESLRVAVRTDSARLQAVEP